MAKSIFSRKADLIYLVFFILHIPIMFAVDLYPFWPTSVRPEVLTTIRQYYVTTYRDQYFISPPSWFTTYLYLELLYHIPLSFWAIGALLRDDPKIPIHLLIFACEVSMTTLTCVADYMSWSGYLTEEKWKLSGLYVPYLALAVFMGVDMYARLDKMITQHSRSGSKSIKKRQ